MEKVVIKKYKTASKTKSEATVIDERAAERLLDIRREQNNYDIGGEYTMSGLLMGWKKKR